MRIPNVNYRENGVRMCKKLPIFEGHPSFKGTIVAVKNGVNADNSYDKMKGYSETQTMNIYSYNSSLDPDYWTYVGFSILGAVALATTISVGIFFAVKQGCREAFFFVK